MYPRILKALGLIFFLGLGVIILGVARPGPNTVIWIMRILPIIVLAALAYSFWRGRARYVCRYPDGLRTIPMSYDNAYRYARMTGGTVERVERK